MRFLEARRQTESLFGNIPKEWRIERLHDVSDLRTSNVDKKTEEGEVPVQLCNYVDVYKNFRITPELDFMSATATESQVERFALKQGDVVITKDSETPDDIGVPAYVSVTISRLVCGYHLTLIRPNQELILGEYLFYALLSRLSAYQFHIAANGVTRFGLTYQGTKNLRIAFPGLEQQAAIVEFLNRKLDLLTTLIGGKQTRFEKLEGSFASVIGSLVEYRSSLITAATSGKIDLQRMKPGKPRK